MTPERESALLQESAGGRAELVRRANFAQGFNPEGWTASILQRASSTHPRGAPCFRKGKQVIHELPEGYMALPSGKVAHEKDVSSVTVRSAYADNPYASAHSDGYESAEDLFSEGPDDQPGVNVKSLDNYAPVIGMSRRQRRLMLLGAVRPALPRLPPVLRESYQSASDLAGNTESYARVDAITKLARHRNSPGPHTDLAVSAGGMLADALYPHDLSGNEQAFAHYMRNIRAKLRTAETGHQLPILESKKVYGNQSARLVRSIVGDPYHPHTIPVSPQLRRLAIAAYDHDDPAHLGPLSDALEEAGADEYTLKSLRDPHAAVRGHWVLDALIGKGPHR